MTRLQVTYTTAFSVNQALKILIFDILMYVRLDRSSLFVKLPDSINVSFAKVLRRHFLATVIFK